MTATVEQGTNGNGRIGRLEGDVHATREAVARIEKRIEANHREDREDRQELWRHQDRLRDDVTALQVAGSLARGKALAWQALLALLCSSVGGIIVVAMLRGLGVELGE